jgi:hypothetical protein
VTAEALQEILLVEIEVGGGELAIRTPIGPGEGACVHWCVLGLLIWHRSLQPPTIACNLLALADPSVLEAVTEAVQVMVD